jgi:hypothetical protein
MTHAGVQQRCLRRRQADSAKQDAAFLQPTPARDHRKKLIDPRGTASAEHAAKGIEDIAARRFDGAHRQIRIAGGDQVEGRLDQCAQIAVMIAAPSPGPCPDQLI